MRSSKGTKQVIAGPAGGAVNGAGNCAGREADSGKQSRNAIRTGSRCHRETRRGSNRLAQHQRTKFGSCLFVAIRHKAPLSTYKLLRTNRQWHLGDISASGDAITGRICTFLAGTPGIFIKPTGLTVSVPSSAKIRIMTPQLKGDFAPEGHKFTAQHGNTIEVRQYPLGRVSNGIIEL